MTRSAVTVTGVRFTPSSAADERCGLLGYVRVTRADAVVLDGIALRRTAGGRLALSFPCREVRRDRRRHLVRPASDAARRDLERQVLEAIDIQEALP